MECSIIITVSDVVGIAMRSLDDIDIRENECFGERSRLEFYFSSRATDFNYILQEINTLSYPKKTLETEKMC